MQRKLAIVMGLAFATTASAQFKCVASGGAISFQQAPCSNAAGQTKITVRVNGGDAPAAPAARASEAPYERQLTAMARERKTRELTYEIQRLEDGIASRNQQMTADLDALRHKKSFARNNLAGATFEQSVSTEMQAITQKYKTLNDVDVERLKQIRTELVSQR